MPSSKFESCLFHEGRGVLHKLSIPGNSNHLRWLRLFVFVVSSCLSNSAFLAQTWKWKDAHPTTPLSPKPAISPWRLVLCSSQLWPSLGPFQPFPLGCPTKLQAMEKSEKEVDFLCLEMGFPLISRQWRKLYDGSPQREGLPQMGSDPENHGKDTWNARRLF